jgi:hypothetical protein
MYECAAPGDERFVAEHPEPQLVYLEPVPSGPDATDSDLESPGYDAYPDVDPESEAKLDAWTFAREQARSEHWEAACRPRCVSAFASAGSATLEACDEMAVTAYDWSRFALREESPSSVARNAGILGALMGAGMLGGGAGLTVVDDEEAPLPFPGALGSLLRRDSGLEGATACFPSLTDEGDALDLELEFDARGHVASARALGERTEGACVEAIASRLSVPAPAAAALEVVRVRVHVHPPMTGIFGAGLDSTISETDWGGLMGGQVGEAYGVGGLGLTGTGQGGGGTGEGTIGLGSIGGASGSTRESAGAAGRGDRQRQRPVAQPGGDPIPPGPH